MKKYDPKKIEPKWQKKWEKEGVFKAKDFSKKKKLYMLVEFPYSSGEGLHTGHCRSYVAMDVLSRKRRMEGYNVLYPIGWDAFGLPTENYAIKKGLHPAVVTKKNTDTFRRQLKKMGLSFDWQREINTTDPEYYKWTQWIFVQLFKKGLAYKQKSYINWCPSCKIGLANEEVVSGECERCGAKAGKKEKEQWMIKITKYADRLIKDLEKADYLGKIKIQQKEWIGKSKGALVKFWSEEVKDSIEVFTTRIDTLFGCTFLVLAPEYPLIEKIKGKIENWKEVENYINKAKNKSDLERQELQKEKTGIEIKGIRAVNPANKKTIPIFVADYVMINYGTGAIMAVPSHDERDLQFAEKYDLPIQQVITKDGTLENSEKFNGLSSEEAKDKIIEFVKGRKSVSYKLRDWVFSRQHYWGEPIPMVYCNKCKWVPVSEKDLPVELPKVKKYQPADTGESPLSLMEKWVNVKCPKCKGGAKRETDTMPNWAGSNWYFLRYIDPKNKKKLADPKKLKYWMPVDWYNGGMEHTTLHLLYSRFIFKFLWDIKAVPKEIGPEPYNKRTAHGMVLGEGGIKMSKSKGNVVNPEEMVNKHGTDALRVYGMFMGPFDQAISWNSKGLNGAERFLEKAFNISVSKETSPEIKRNLHKTIKKVSEDIDSLKFNTAISSLMEFCNSLKEGNISREDFKLFIQILSPFAPHISEELWKVNKFKGLCSVSSWPKYDKSLLESEETEFVVQVNGKVRTRIFLNSDSSKEEVEKEALSNKRIIDSIGGKEIKRTVFVPKKLINFVI